MNPKKYDYLCKTGQPLEAAGDTQTTGITNISSSAEAGDCVPQMEARGSSLRPHIIGSPFLTVTRRSTTLMPLDDSLIRMTALSRYIGIICSPWSHQTFFHFPARKSCEFDPVLSFDLRSAACESHRRRDWGRDKGGSICTYTTVCVCPCVYYYLLWMWVPTLVLNCLAQ